MSQLSSFLSPIDALVVGANGGLGKAFVDALLTDPHVRSVHAWSRDAISKQHPKLSARAIDAGDEDAVREAARHIERLTLIIIATGVLHRSDGLAPEKSWKALDPANMMESFRINTVLPAIIAKHTLPKVPRKGKSVVCALSARVGSVSDNRLGGWYSYRSSKAALNQILKCLSIELRRTHPEAVCLGLHPGTVDTGLSEPFQSSMTQGHHLFSPEESATQLLRVINQAADQQSGTILAWDGSVVPA